MTGLDWTGSGNLISSCHVNPLPCLSVPFRSRTGCGLLCAFVFHFLSHLHFIRIHVTPALSHVAAPFNATPSMPLPANLHHHPPYHLLSLPLPLQLCVLLYNMMHNFNYEHIGIHVPPHRGNYPIRPYLSFIQYKLPNTTCNPNITFLSWLGTGYSFIDHESMYSSSSR